MTRPQYTQQTNGSKPQSDLIQPLSFVHCGTDMASLSCVLVQIWILVHHNRRIPFCRMNTFLLVCFIRQFQQLLGHLLHWWSLFQSKILFLVPWCEKHAHLKVDAFVNLLKLFQQCFKSLKSYRCIYCIWYPSLHTFWHQVDSCSLSFNSICRS